MSLCIALFQSLAVQFFPAIAIVERVTQPPYVSAARAAVLARPGIEASTPLVSRTFFSLFRIDRRFSSPTAQYWLNNLVRALLICFCASLVIAVQQLGLIISLIGAWGAFYLLADGCAVARQKGRYARGEVFECNGNAALKAAEQRCFVSLFPLLALRDDAWLLSKAVSPFSPLPPHSQGSLGSGLLALIFPPLFHLIKMRQLSPTWVSVKDGIVLAIGIVGEFKGLDSPSFLSCAGRVILHVGRAVAAPPLLLAPCFGADPWLSFHSNRLHCRDIHRRVGPRRRVKGAIA